jgi:hypothetical protein
MTRPIRIWGALVLVVLMVPALVTATDETPQPSKAPSSSLRVTGTHVQGRQIGLDLAPGRFAVENVSLAGRPVIARVALNGSEPTLRLEEDDAVLESEGATLTVADSDTLAMDVLAESARDASWELGPGWGRSYKDADGAGWDRGGLHLDLRLHDHASLTQATNDSFIAIHLPDGAAVEVRFYVDADPVAEQVSEAFRNGTLGAEVDVESQSGENQAGVVEHGDVHASGRATGQEVVLLVSARSHHGRTFVIKMPPATTVADLRDLRVQVDGAYIGPSSGISRVLRPDAGTPAEFFVIQSGGRAQVLVSLPTMSAHEIRVQSLGATIVRDALTPQNLAMVATAVVACAFLGLVLVRRKA